MIWNTVMQFALQSSYPWDARIFCQNLNQLHFQNSLVKTSRLSFEEY